MILPTKHLPIDRSMVAIGADILRLLDKPKSVSKLWVEFQDLNAEKDRPLTFDWFTLTLSMLYSLDAIEQSGKRLKRREDQS